MQVVKIQTAGVTLSITSVQTNESSSDGVSFTFDKDGGNQEEAW